jgi:tetratricopeptide (TPR) repeat protein
VTDDGEQSRDSAVPLPVVMDGRLVLMPIPVPRRRFPPLAGGAPAEFRAPLETDKTERLRAVVGGQAGADAQVAHHLEVVLAHYRVLDDLIGPQRMLGPVQAFTAAIDTVRKESGAGMQRALLQVAAQYDQLTGWLWVDSGNHAMARLCYDRALARAVEGGGHALARYLLACKSEQALMARQIATAIMLAQEAQSIEGAPDGTWYLTPAVRAWAADLESRGWALLREEKLCKQKLEEAEELLATSTGGARAEEPPWIYHFVPEALDVHRGICHTALGETGAAISVFEEAIAAVPEQRPRDRAYYLCWLARAHAGNNEPDRASEVARHAVQLGIETDSTRVVDEVRLLHGELDPQMPAVRELGELLQQAAG